jgi:hypothetical protein
MYGRASGNCTSSSFTCTFTGSFTFIGSFTSAGGSWSADGAAYADECGNNPDANIPHDKTTPFHQQCKKISLLIERLQNHCADSTAARASGVS